MIMFQTQRRTFVKTKWKHLRINHVLILYQAATESYQIHSAKNNSTTPSKLVLFNSSG